MHIMSKLLLTLKILIHIKHFFYIFIFLVCVSLGSLCIIILFKLASEHLKKKEYRMQTLSAP